MQGLDKRYADISYAPAEFARLAAAISEAAAVTKPMPSEETAAVKRLAKIGLKSESFAREALDVARSNPTLLPVALDVERMAENLRNRDELMAFMVQLEQLYARVRVAVVLHGVDAYADGLAVYHSLQRYGKDDNLREVTQRLGRIFKGKGRRQKKQEGEAPVQSAKVAPIQPVSPAAAPVSAGAKVESGSQSSGPEPTGAAGIHKAAGAEEEQAAGMWSGRSVMPKRRSGERSTFREAAEVYGGALPLVCVMPSGGGSSRFGWSGAPAVVSFATFDPGAAHFSE